MRNYKIATVMGIPINVSISLLVFLPILAWLIGSGAQIVFYAGVINDISTASLDPDVLQAGFNPWIIGIISALGLFVSVAVHELGHSWVARRYGLTIESITLWIFGGVAKMDVPREWNREFWIAIAGPVTSVVLGAGFYAVLQVLPAVPSLVFVVGWLAFTNVVLAVFNLLPAFPMDGGRVLRALLARNRPYLQATTVAATVGRGFAILMAVAGALTFNVVLLLVALFIYGAAAAESQSVTMTELLKGIEVGELMTREIVTVRADSTVQELIDRMLREHHSGYPVTDEGEIVGIVTLADLRQVREVERDAYTVGDVMSESPVTVPVDTPAIEVLRTIVERDIGRALVERNGEVVGIVSRSDFVNAMNVRRETMDTRRRRVVGSNGL